MKTLLELTDQKLTSHAGLALIAPYLKNKEFRSEISAASRVIKKSGVISDVDILCCWIAMLALGKSDYQDIEEYRNDENFKFMLGLQDVPSCSVLRQRIEGLPEDISVILRDFNKAIVAGAFELAKEHPKSSSRHQETDTIDDTAYAIINSDVSVLDNSGSRKEGVSWTYKKCDGYAPMFSYMGKSGYMLNCELREGSMHSNAEGTLEYFEETIGLAKQVTDLPLLFVLDSGNDDKKLLNLFEQEAAYYVVKRNLRKESPLDWLEIAKTHQKHTRVGRDGSTIYYASITRDISIGKQERTIRIVVVARERLWDENNQLLIEPEVRIETYWTNLPSAELQVEKVYHMQGTMEQYHAELKSDMGVERLPSGKFHANMMTLLFSMIAFNLLRRVGMTLLRSEQTPGKRGRRLRLRTVLQSVMYMAGLFAHHGGSVTLRISSKHAWAKAFQWSYTSYSTA